MGRIPWFWAQLWELDQVISSLGLRYLICKERKCCLTVETVPGWGEVAGGPRFLEFIVLFEMSLELPVPKFLSATRCTVSALLVCCTEWLAGV